MFNRTIGGRVRIETWRRLVSWSRLRHEVLYRLKSLQFGAQAWCRSREIAKAYATPRMPLRFHVQRHARLIMAIVVAAVITGALVAALPHAARGVVALGRRAVVAAKKMASAPRREVRRPPARQDRRAARKATPAAARPTTAAAVAAAVPAPAPDTVVTPRVPREVDPRIAKEIEAEPYHVLLAEKARRTLYLLQFEGKEWGVHREYAMAIGGQDGQKQTSGDRRTPEGTYFIVGRKESNELSQVYGPLAYVLNYPNDDDRAAGRTGQGIWIHGTQKDSVPVTTRGCIELHNSNLLELSSFLHIGIGTPIVIVNDSVGQPADLPGYAAIHRSRKGVLDRHRQAQVQFEALLGQWTAAWESMDIERYSRHYAASSFLGEGKTVWAEWRERKVRTFEIYSTITVDVSKLVVTDLSDSVAIVKFLQVYESDKSRFVNGKKLSFIREHNAWKIFRENTFPKEELYL